MNNSTRFSEQPITGVGSFYSGEIKSKGQIRGKPEWWYRFNHAVCVFFNNFIWRKEREKAISSRDAYVFFLKTIFWFLLMILLLGGVLRRLFLGFVLVSSICTFAFMLSGYGPVSRWDARCQCRGISDGKHGYLNVHSSWWWSRVLASVA